jgi:GNAT superfamily N-acetyltransferase
MIEFARWDMRRDLSALWQECFHDPKRYPDFFLNNIFSPRDCLVCRFGTEIASAVYLLPAQVAAGRRTRQAHYIFAAATLPRFRSRGCMSSLLAYAALAGAKRGDRFSLVLPSGESLYRFYGAAGYRGFFQARELSVPAGRLRALAKAGKPAGRLLLGSERLNSFRNRLLARCGGSMLWSGRMFHFAVSMSRVYGDRLICAEENGRPAYALCRTEGDLCSVLELMSGEAAFPALAAAILREAPAAGYRFRLPVAFGPFSGEGETVRFGMAKPLGGTLPGDVEPHGPYLGLAMD